MPNLPYDNFFLSNEIEDQFNSHLNLQRFATVDNGLVGTAGMKRKINKYSATNGTQKLQMGVGNTQSITAGYIQKEYSIELAQNRFEYYDEEAMTDPLVVTTGVRHQGTDLFNTMNDDVYGELLSGSIVIPTSSFDFDAFADALAAMEVENLEGVETFALVAPDDMAALRKALKDDLKYNESFARTGYIGTVAGVNLYIKKDATSGTIPVATKQAVTIFNKKGTEVEQVTKNQRSETAANTRLNTVFARKYYICALTDETKDIILMSGVTATAVPSTETSVVSGKTYYEKSGVSYIKVTPAAADNPYTKGWYTIA